MEPRIEILIEKWLVGHSMKMSLIENKTGLLWGGFGPHLKRVTNRVGDDKISMQVYDATYFDSYNPAMEFEKWATVEISSVSVIPEGMKTYNLPGGLYAVFDHKGSSSDTRIFDYIFRTWLPNSQYILDDRPHFERLGAKYKNNDPNSEEEIWIPVKKK
jgi:AraC family transcriptional regulator